MTLCWSETQRLVPNRGQRCGDIELTAFLADVPGPVNLVMDLRIVSKYENTVMITIIVPPFLHLQELRLCNIRTCSVSTALFSTPSSNLRLVTSSSRPLTYVSTSTSMVFLYLLKHILTPPIHKLNLSFPLPSP